MTIIASTELEAVAYGTRNGSAALVVGCLLHMYGLYRYVPEDERVLQGLAGLLVVTLGGSTPLSVLGGTRFGYWLVEDTPVLLALDISILVVIFALVYRRALSLVFEDDAVEPSSR
ncbi:hypothetical protein [Natrinema gelatinilyticum]|uniref:hypothetical protein n=1 Tax=Natrinema gelatinilyticum TaxID=2961571 RepID=UPI0020C3FB47|nr:hypothetical protein [Natrinema gelatinilyticum]